MAKHDLLNRRRDGEQFADGEFSDGREGESIGDVEDGRPLLARADGVHSDLTWGVRSIISPAAARPRVWGSASRRVEDLQESLEIKSRNAEESNGVLPAHAFNLVPNGRRKVEHLAKHR